MIEENFDDSDAIVLDIVKELLDEEQFKELLDYLNETSTRRVYD